MDRDGRSRSPGARTRRPDLGGVADGEGPARAAPRPAGSRDRGRRGAAVRRSRRPRPRSGRDPRPAAPAAWRRPGRARSRTSGDAAGRQEELARRQEDDLVDGADRPLVGRVEPPERVDLVAEELDPDRQRARRREDVDDAAAPGELAAAGDLEGGHVAEVEQLGEERLEAEAGASPEASAARRAGRPARSCAAGAPGRSRRGPGPCRSATRRGRRRGRPSRRGRARCVPRRAPSVARGRRPRSGRRARPPSSSATRSPISASRAIQHSRSPAPARARVAARYDLAPCGTDVRPAWRPLGRSGSSRVRRAARGGPRTSRSPRGAAAAPRGRARGGRHRPRPPAAVGSGRRSRPRYGRVDRSAGAIGRVAEPASSGRLASGVLDRGLGIGDVEVDLGTHLPLREQAIEGAASRRAPSRRSAPRLPRSPPAGSSRSGASPRRWRVAVLPHRSSVSAGRVRRQPVRVRRIAIRAGRSVDRAGRGESILVGRPQLERVEAVGGLARAVPGPRLDARRRPRRAARRGAAARSGWNVPRTWSTNPRSGAPMPTRRRLNFSVPSSSMIEPQAVVAAGPAALAEAELAERQGEVVGDDEQVGQRRVLAGEDLADGDAAVVHEGQRLDERQVEAVVATGDDGARVPRPALAVPAGPVGQPVEDHPADVVPRLGVLVARVPQAHDDLHQASGIAWPAGHAERPGSVRTGLPAMVAAQSERVGPAK